MQSAGGGGFGPPWEREVGRVVDDVLDGYVSREAAKTEYGVVIDDAGAVDQAATDDLRRQMSSAAYAAGGPAAVDRGSWTYGGISM
jgi:N-methylhydantoinase B